MIYSADERIAEILELLLPGAEPASVPAETKLRLATVLFLEYDRGFAAGREHAVRIVQRRAVDPMPIVREIRRPVR